MPTGLIVLGLIIVFVVGGLLAFRFNAGSPLPGNPPPPLKDDDDT